MAQIRRATSVPRANPAQAGSNPHIRFSARHCAHNKSTPVQELRESYSDPQCTEQLITVFAQPEGQQQTWSRSGAVLPPLTQ